jgi:GTPase SAR1 family protein
MGCTVSVVQSPAGADLEITNDAEKLLLQSLEEEKYRLKILLLGAGESGKSTVVKQIKVIWNVPEEPDENLKYVQPLQRNVIEAVQTLLQAGRKLSVEIENPLLRGDAEKLLALDSHARVTPELAPVIEKLWKDAGIQKIYERRSEFWLMDATPYYLTEVNRIADKDFSPNEDDMIMARVRTTGIVVSEVVEKPFKFDIVDVGGQRSERRKWIHCFDDVKAVIYLASLSGYNQGTPGQHLLF